MSMILDALSRAEKERQTENSVDLDANRYATSSTIKENRFKKWVLIALVANFFVVTAFAGSYLWKNYFDVSESSPNPIVERQADVVNETPADDKSGQTVSPSGSLEVPLATQQQPVISLVKLTDNENQATPRSSLLDEAKVKRKNPATANSKKTTVSKTTKSSFRKIPPVQYSSEPLSQSPKSNEPSVATITQAVAREKQLSVGAYTKLTDLPVAQRAQLGQYEVNVHVYDDRPSRRFVLINMVKYKEGDQVSGGNISISSIVPEGVVLSYGNEQILIERNQ